MALCCKKRPKIVPDQLLVRNYFWPFLTENRLYKLPYLSMAPWLTTATPNSLNKKSFGRSEPPSSLQYVDYTVKQTSRPQIILKIQPPICLDYKARNRPQLDPNSVNRKPFGRSEPVFTPSSMSTTYVRDSEVRAGLAIDIVVNFVAHIGKFP